MFKKTFLFFIMFFILTTEAQTTYALLDNNITKTSDIFNETPTKFLTQTLTLNNNNIEIKICFEFYDKNYYIKTSNFYLLNFAKHIKILTSNNKITTKKLKHGKIRLNKKNINNFSENSIIAIRIFNFDFLLKPDQQTNIKRDINSLLTLSTQKDPNHDL